MTGHLPPDIAEALDALLGDDDPVHLALRAQTPHLRVHGRCPCGCGTTYFDLDTAAVQPAPSGPRTVVAAQAPICTENGDSPGEVLAFAQTGHLSWPEVCSWSDDTKVTPALARRALRR
ncbi:hypothetical protein [Kitasatospora sp. CB02891]|uniref:hypothetical protein n=1 Tax=Kitasatospora sp. CB02891 TaxID=2020329 RepID=UPI000C273E03|nr:hypothetical protein [Kitasatospora sp. CB02891]PJN21098.1 hypothetical protein CG736_35180 [Kitasatospora sp. CB02891]